MSKTRYWLLFAGFIWALFLGSCILPEPNHIEPDFYLLHLPRYDTNQSIQQGASSLSFYIREVELPQYLKSNRLTQKSSMEVVKFRDYKRWGEPLADGISRVLGGSLSHRLGTLEYSSFPNRRRNNCQFEISLSVLAFEKTFSDQALLEANIEVKPKDGLIKREYFKSQVLIEGMEVVSEIRALSMCLDQLSERLCEIINSSIQKN
jgi:uncharacterized lipoprotein YmbA